MVVGVMGEEDKTALRPFGCSGFKPAPVKLNVLILKTANLPNSDIDLAGPVLKLELPNGP